MNILIISLSFYPDTGGQETVMYLLGKQFIAKGHSVIVYTHSQSNQRVLEGMQVFRNTSSINFLRLLKKTDIILEANVSLRTGLFCSIFSNKWFLVHHTFYEHGNLFTGRIKKWFTRFAHNITVSTFMQRKLGIESIVLYNPYNSVFKNFNNTRQKEFLYVGRLVSDKGIKLLINAFALLNEKAILTLCGEGNEEHELRELVELLGIQDKVNFVGGKTPNEICDLYNDHKIVIVPSDWDEPFGLVAIEALACGCKVIVSNRGGLPEAVGNFGIIIDVNNSEQFRYAMLKALLSDINEIENQGIAHHLRNHLEVNVVENYLAYLTSAIDKSN